MTIRHLRIFVAVAETGKMSAAAERCFVTQPTVSQAIRELEDGTSVWVVDLRSNPGGDSGATSLSAGLFTGVSIPDSRTEEVLQELTAQLRNIVLIGMPGCGKSSVGQVLAGRLGKQFADLDQLIEEEARKPIPRIFSEDGEEAFRRLESEVIRKIGAVTGHVLSAGGGAVTRRENYAPLHQNGVIVHILRDLSLLPTAGRPVSQSTDLRELWRRRAPLYAAFADLTADNAGTIEDAADQMIKELEKL